MAIAPGLRIGRYDVLTKLGQGGFGIIYIGRDTELDRDVALKFLRPEHVARPDVVMRFLQEARSAAKINHPGIVTMFECGQVTNTNTRADGTVYIAMELLAGESLSQRLKRERLLPPAFALGITRQLCAALQAAHTAGIVHRDLKPDNIFLVPDPAMRDGIRVKILDFGVAKLADGQFGPSGGVRTHSAMVLGTPTYMSPEQCKSSAKVDHRSDIYALGCILYELLCGARPYDGDAGEQIAKHQLAPVPVPRAVNPAIPPELDALVTQMLAKTPDERPGSMEFVDEALAMFERAPAPPAPAARSSTNVPAPLPTAITMFEAENAPTKVTAAGPSRRALVAGAAGVIVLGVVLGIIVTRADTAATKETVAAPVPADAATVAVAPDAQVVVPAVVAPDEKPDVKMECLKLAADRKWPELVTCTDTLSPTDPDTAKSLRAKAVLENKAETAARKLAEALAANDLVTAKAQLAKIPDDSVYRAEAKAKVDEREPSRSPRTTATVAKTKSPEPDEPPPAACDADALRDKGQDHLQTGMDAAALAAFEASMKCRPDAGLLRLAFMAACRSGNQAKAEYYYPKLPTATTTGIVMICTRNGVKLPLPCDADALRAKGEEHAKSGMDAAALAAFEASLKCKPNPEVMRLAFTAACHGKNAAKAKAFYPKLPTATTTGIVQICVRNGITLP